MQQEEIFRVDAAGRRGRGVMRAGAMVLLVALAGMGGCKKKSGPGEAITVPKRAGDVWEIDPAAGRAQMPAAVLAYVNGLDTIVLDGDEAYAGMTSLRLGSGPNGARTIALPNHLGAQLVPTASGGMELRFSSGESIPMRRK